MCNRTSRPCCSVSASSASRATQTLRPSRWPALSATSTPPALPSLQPGRLRRFPSDYHQTSSTHSRRPQPGRLRRFPSDSHQTSSTHSRRAQPGRLPRFPSDSHQTSSTHSRRPQPGRLPRFPSDSHQTSSTHSRSPQPGVSHASRPTPIRLLLPIHVDHSRGDSHASRPTTIRLLLPIHVDHSRETPTLPIRPLLPIHVFSETVSCQASKTCLPPYDNDMCSRVSTFRMLIVPSRRTCHVVFSQLCHQL